MNPLPSLRRAALSGGFSKGCLIGCGCAAVGTILICIVAAVIFGVVMTAIKSSAPYKDSIATVEKNSSAVEALGQPIEPGLFISGKINISNGKGTANMSIPVKGPKGSGTIQVEGTKASGSDQWNYTTWQLNLPDGKSIPLGQ